VLPLDTALAKAQEFGLDLVEVSPMAKPPVCKIMDYGKFKYETKKKASEAKKKQTIVKLKEVKFRPKTEEHDYAFKVKAIREFLAEGNKARVTVMFRGREITHREIGQNILRRIETELKDIAVVEQTARMEGRLLFMILTANPRFLQQQKAREQQAAQASAAAQPRAGGQAPRPGAAPVSRPGVPAQATRPGTPTNGAPRPAASNPAPAPVQRAEAPKA
jgi:translation initiation factor IF-3